MVKEIDVGASQMGIEVLTNKGSEDNPTKSVELQKAPDKPYTIEEHSKMFEAMGNPENLLTNIIENKKQVKIFHNLRVKNQIKIQAV